MLMGGADIIPGVSGGTVALILGIYERLVAAISHFDLELIRLLGRRQWRKAAAHVDLRFLIALGCGILTGIVSLASLMNGLLKDDHTRPLTLAAFFGLILASAVLVAKMIKAKRNTDVPVLVILAALGAIFAYWLTGQTPGAVDEPSLLYVFLCGTVAICAMILPGISGAFILVILGMYLFITGLLHDILHAIWHDIKSILTLHDIKNFETEGYDLLIVAVFCAGCAVGLIVFSKFLRWLLARHEPQTMALLCGFMFGSLRKIWPFKKEVTLERLKEIGLPREEQIKYLENPDSVVQLKLQLRQFENEWPAGDDRVLLIVGIALAAALFVFVLDRITRA
jgi:putative membrane protein